MRGFRPSTVPQSGHRWTTSLHDFIRNGIKQQTKPPTKKTTQHIHHVPPLIRYSVLVITCCWHDLHKACCRYRWKLTTFPSATSVGWTIVGEGSGGWSVGKNESTSRFSLKKMLYTSILYCLMLNGSIWWRLIRWVEWVWITELNWHTAHYSLSIFVNDFVLLYRSTSSFTFRSVLFLTLFCSYCLCFSCFALTDTMIDVSQQKLKILINIFKVKHVYHSIDGKYLSSLILIFLALYQ